MKFYKFLCAYAYAFKYMRFCHLLSCEPGQKIKRTFVDWRGVEVPEVEVVPCCPSTRPCNCDSWRRCLHCRQYSHPRSFHRPPGIVVVVTGSRLHQLGVKVAVVRGQCYIIQGSRLHQLGVKVTLVRGQCYTS